MQRRNDDIPRLALVLERVVWNVAAGAVLAVMIWVLLGSLRWLDAVSPPASRPPVSAGTVAPDPTPSVETDVLRSAEIADAGPSG